MALFENTASATAKIAPGATDIRTQEDADEYINTYFDDTFDEFEGEIDAAQLLSYFRSNTQKKDVDVTKTRVRGNAVAGINEDGDDIPMVTWGQGWAYSWYVYPYRLGASHTAHYEEVDDLGDIAQEADELMDGGKRTIYYAAADVFNRAITPTNAPFTCYDGMYLIDSHRPNPVVGVPDWSNEETTGDITEDLLFTASQNALNSQAHNGDRLRQHISRIIIPDGYEQVMWKLNNTEGTVGNAMNDRNWAKGRFTYETNVDFTGNTIFYLLGDPGSKDNGLEIRWAVQPNLADINYTDPDVKGKRLRFRFGLGCLDPRKMWRGGLLNAL